MKNKKLEIQIEDKKMSHAAGKRGTGWLDWQRLEDRLKETDELMDDQCFERIRVGRDGIEFTTNREK